MGPLPGESNSALNKFFPAYYKTRPLVSKNKINEDGRPILADPNGAEDTSTTSKPPVHSKRKASQTVVSDDEDKSPPRTRQGHKKRQKTVTPSGKEKGSGSSKITSPSDKVSSEESPLQVANKSHVLWPFVEDAQPLATIIPTMPVEESHSTDDSPPTHKSGNMGADRQCSSSNNAAGHLTGSEDTVSEQDAMEETSKLATAGPHETSPFGTIVASHSSSWKAATDATKKGDALKLKRSEKQKEYDECEQNIKSWKQEITKLEEKIKEAESRQATIQQINEQELAEVANLGIQHFEAAQKLVPEIEELKKQRALIELCMSSWEVQYSKIKDNLPRDFN
ncbi:uncharacterized protein LOC131636449 [Vicia villosa]|uniref:uncharacterized protein LOC131636449 n=1 Tax=Vicia villosa TaxID=3911 RepID=UPI00273B4148|nr:uncharacterized protein LOC131636449 [Vicia villosa]